MVTISESSQEVKDPVHLVFFFCEQMFLSCEILNFRFQEQQDKLCAILCIWAMFLIHRMLSPCLHNVKIKCMVWFIEIRLTASRLPEHARCSAGVHNGGLICEGVVNWHIQLACLFYICNIKSLYKADENKRNESNLKT